MTIAAAIVVTCDRAGLADAAAALVIFCAPLDGCTPQSFTYVVRRPDRADSWLTEVTSRIEQSGPMLLTLACALGSVFLLADGIRGLIAG